MYFCVDWKTISSKQKLESIMLAFNGYSGKKVDRKAEMYFKVWLTKIDWLGLPPISKWITYTTRRSLLHTSLITAVTGLGVPVKLCQTDIVILREIKELNGWMQ